MTIFVDFNWFALLFDQFSLIFHARAASRTGWSKKSHLEVDVGAILDPKQPQNDPNGRPSQGSEATWSSKVSSVRSFRPVRPVGLVSSRHLGRPGGAVLNLAGAYGLGGTTLEGTPLPISVPALRLPPSLPRVAKCCNFYAEQIMKPTFTPH